MVDADLDQIPNAGFTGAAGLREAVKRVIDMRAIGINLAARWTCQQTPVPARMPLALGLVIGIETIGKPLVENTITSPRRA